MNPPLSAAPTCVRQASRPVVVAAAPPARTTPDGPSRDRVGLRLLLILALLNAAGPLSIDTYLSAFPRMARDLGTTATSIQLTLTTFMLGIGVGHLVIGALSDRWGRRGPLLASVVVFGVAGALCAVAPSVAVLVALRFLQGFAGSAGMVIGRAVVADSVRGRAAVQAYSLLSMVGALAPVVAPVLGASLLPVLGWRGLFWGLVGVGALMLLAVMLGVRETLSSDRRTTGGLRETGRVAREVLSSRPFRGYTGAVVLSFGALFAYVSASPFVVQGVLGLTPGQYAADFAVNSTALVIVGGLNARLVLHVRATRLLTIGLVTLAAAALALLGLAAAGSTSTGVVLPLLFVVMAATALVFANGVALAMGSVTTGLGTASAVIGSAQFGVGALVSPLVGLGGADTALPMALVMCACAGGALLSLRQTRTAGRRGLRR
ncbi:multidrug effflux MFS transporter [Dermatophilaceae bacterium Soc4.6]